MDLVIKTLILICGIVLCDGGYSEGQDAQSDVQAPAYVPAYLKNQKFPNSNYSGRKTSYSGTKTSYSGTKTSYSGTKTGYSGTKNPTKSYYGERKTWDTETGHGPTYEDVQNSARRAHENYEFMAKCVPECKNNGICVATNTCQCPPDYRGQYCELVKKPCLLYPPLPMNSKRSCSSDFCTVLCMPGYKFPDGTTVANMVCAEGQWRPTRADFTTIPDCQPECEPRCENGGVCLALNTCQCPEDFRGPQCQYAASVCDVRKLAFNGGYSCFGDAEKFSCKLNCPSGSTYSTPKANLYTCRYDSGGIFQPQPIPHCVFNDAYVITPSSTYNSSSSYYESHSWHSSGGSSSGSYGGGSYGGGGHSGGGYGSSHDGSWTSTGDSQWKNIPSGSQVVVRDLTPKSGICLTWAGAHYKTFDGKIYSFKSQCRHILVRDRSQHKVTLAVKPGNCTRRAYCPSEITVYVEDKPYTLAVHPEDGSVLFRSSKRLIPIPASLPGLRVSMPADYVVVNLDAAGLTLTWDTNDVILVESSILLWNNTEGLCGSLNSNPEDDLTTREGGKAKTTPAMASSWQLNKIEDICESNPSELHSCAAESEDVKKKAKQFCAKIFSKDKFRKCSTVMDVSLLLEACQGDYCACASSDNSEDCACSTVSVYAKECMRNGVQEMKYWRDPETCPKTCPDGKLYKVCGPDSQPTCAFPQPVTTNNATCVEGCFCPEGLLLESGRCIPKEECPCRLRNKNFKPGSVIPKDCNKCTCEAGAWTCTQAACGARCSAVGDPHYSTFDGRRYDFMGRCTYTLLRAGNITLEAENVACEGAISEVMNLTPYKGEGKPSCTKAVKLLYGGTSIHMKQGGLILVDGQEVSSLPVSVAGVRIRAASSLFVIVQLPMKVDVWWDGFTRVFVDVPASFQGKTEGLCGTFNLNQKDDFLTPEGDVEQSTFAFANKWKTREFCSDVATVEPEHPCKANMQNKEAAEKYCSKLKSKLFEECSWYVDVEPYYEACLYDMCACDGDVSRCLCPLLGNYAMDCAKAGVRVQWRYNVKECELQCTGGQEYTVCADSCLRTCTDVVLSGTGQCKPCCVEGCACPPGEVLDDNNACVPQGLCPCKHKGMKFDAGYKEVRPGRRERELCTCVGARWECVPATDADIQNYPPAEDLRSNCSATNHMEFTSCQLKEPLTCKNMHLPPTTTSTECRPGCQCKKGFVLDTGSGQCVPAAHCPCHHGGRSYPDGGNITDECNHCVCKSGNWSCTEQACAGVCGAWGDSHVDTFDGAAYDFEGVCTYLLAKGVMDSSDGFDVEIQNVPCGTTGATCSKSTTLKVGGGGNREVVSLTKDAPLPDVSKLKRIKLRVAGAYVFLDVPSLGVSLQWDRGLRVYVKVDAVWRNRVKGLCGNYNGDTRDDFQTPSGGGLPESSPVVFADAWKLKPSCPKPKEVTDYCAARPHRREWAGTICGSMKRYPFSLCESEVAAGPYIQRCERDACACDSGADCDCACAALAAYAHACSLRGVSLAWRSQQLCPMQCDEECSHYDGCVSACPAETCDNTVDYADIQGSCQQDVCVEGCKPKKTCPKGFVYTNHTLTECVPRSKCKAVCMTLPDGREVLEGEVLEEDRCHTCRCSKKHKVCTGQPCSTESIPTEATSPKPNDEQLKCVPGWTPWISVHTPTTGPQGASLETEPLPQYKDLTIGEPMCSKSSMTDIECRTKKNHESPKQTGLDVECSLERGLVCRERTGLCPDFEIRVKCECEFQCLNASHPSVAHPTDCSQFYECTPDMLNPSKIHTVLKSCVPGTMYNPVAMVCDWPTAVIALRPECGATTVPTTVASTTTTKATTTTTEEATTSRCGPDQVFKDCVYRCDQLCDYYKQTLVMDGRCEPGEKCIGGCVDKSIADKDCGKGFRWRDDKTCVPIKDCTCFSEGNMIKPGGVVADGCVKCQCLSNEMHCDSSDCATRELPSSAAPILLTTPPTTPVPTTTTTEATTQAPTTVPPIIIQNTASPPPECSPDGYKYLLWSDDTEPKPILTASSIAGAPYEPEYAVLDGRPNAISAGSWRPKTSDQNQYIQIELPYSRSVHGVVLQGDPLLDKYVTSYKLMYGDQPNAYSYVGGANPTVFRGPVDHSTAMKQMISPPVEAKYIRLQPLTWHGGIAVRLEVIGCEEALSTTPEEVITTVFRGPVDHSTAMKQMISPPVEAKYIRLQPLTWHGGIAIRLEVIGCEEALSTTPEEVITTEQPLQCTEPLGLAADLPIESIEVSSNNDARQYFRLDGFRGWMPTYSTPGEWIMFDFTAPRNITGIKTKGGKLGWVSAYMLMYTSDLSTFNPVVDSDGEPRLFPANFDSDSEVFNKFKLPIHARYFKVLPMQWHDAIEMRVEPIGCFEPYPITKTTLSPIPEEIVKAECKVCPGVRTATCSCYKEHEYYDGERCVPRDQCPCVTGYLTYPVGSSFRGDNCDECMCKIGGVTDCQPVKQCECAPNLKPKLVEKPECSCVCEACPPGTRICPTSKICLNVTKWCDGLQDCPDDERDCTTTPPVTTTPMPTRPKEPEVVTTVMPTVAAKPTTPAVTTTPKPVVCPVVQCPPGYMVKYTNSASRSRAYTSDLPPPRPRYSYQRYYRGGTKSGYTQGGYSKGGYSKGGFSKGGYSAPPRPPGPSQAFTLDKPTAPVTPTKQEECVQFTCIAQLPPPPPPGTKPVAVECSAPVCPKGYTLHLDKVPTGANQCPQYGCVPPPARPVYCNVTGRSVSTFDGAEYKYELCDHILARDTRRDAWSILVRKKCRLEGCQNMLIVHQDDQLIKVKPDLMIEYDNYEYTVEQTAKICFQRNSFDVARIGNGLSVSSRIYNFTVLFTTDGDIKIGVLKSAMGYVDGLCGAFDGSLHNEQRLPNGKIAVSGEQMAAAWGRPGLPRDACATRVAHEQEQRRAWELCNVITKEPLSRCGKVLNLDKWRNICLEKICQCKELVVNGTKRSEEQCRCLVVEQMVAECLAADKDADISAWRMQLDCPAECPPPLVHKDCYRHRCEPTCSSLGAQSCPPVDGQCFPGCYCPDGMLRSGDRCLAPRDCLDCVCKGVGTPADYTTFEGDNFPFLGNCTYLASRDRNETGLHRYEVYATNGPCADNANVSCTKAVHVVNDKNVIHITKDPATQKLVTTIGKEPVFKYPVKKSWVTISLLNGQDVSVLLTDESVEVTVQQAKMELAVQVASYTYKNKTEGLCGVCAGQREHLTTSNGTVTEDFLEYGRSWQATPAALGALGLPVEQQMCDQPPPEPCVLSEDNPCFKLLNPDVFGQCHALVDPEQFVEACEDEFCAMNKVDVCSSLERYAAACRQQGVCLDWRAREPQCAKTCEEPLVYRACMDCERTCENHEEIELFPDLCARPPVEGCFCPEGKVRVNNTCIEPNKCFPCDVDKEHFAGDEWQENACKKCTCAKEFDEREARVSCTTQTCVAPLCPSGQDLVKKPPPPGPPPCCPDYMCVPKLQKQCEEPKRMECGFAQVLKEKTTADGCKEFVCECKPASECEHIPTDSEVQLELGMKRVIEEGGCCPRLRLICEPAACPHAPSCPKFHELKTKTTPDGCCPQYSCEPPKDKCIALLEWEAAPKGGEKQRAKSEQVLKDIDAVWTDGPCRWCRCASSHVGAATSCSTTECPRADTAADIVVEPRPLPYACCPNLVPVACRYGARTYKPGETWTSETNPCESYACVNVDGKLQRRITVTDCDTNCLPGWKYSPPEENSGQCCGKCKPVACVLDGQQRPIGEEWTSPDFCTKYICVLVNGTLQVQSSNETCPEIPVASLKQFVYSDEAVAGKCCHKREPVACRVGNKIYQEGQTWPSDDPCVNVTCARDSAGTLTKAESIETCSRDCARGWVYVNPPQGVCCGRCVQDSCLVDDELKKPGSTWQSADNCTTYSCDRAGEELLVSAATPVCPDISDCPAEQIVNETCCQICKPKPQDLSMCAPVEVSGPDSIGMVRTVIHNRGFCVNREPPRGLLECRGACRSGTVYNNATGIHDSKCECCTAKKYSSVDVWLTCADGSRVEHRVATPTACACARCGDTLSGFSKQPTKSGGGAYAEPVEYDIPEIYQRMREAETT